uniref:Uncharacterized protein n=1 Tax=Meloidogyne incognita TaxID=6306 RepID=A0A914KLJ5_MELIC
MVDWWLAKVEWWLALVEWWLAMVAWCFMLLVVEYGSGVPGSTPGSVRALLWWLLYMLFFVFYTARLLNICGFAKENVLQWMPSFYSIHILLITSRFVACFDDV